MKTITLTDRQMDLLEGALLVARANNADFRDKVLSPANDLNAIFAAEERVRVYDRILFEIEEARRSSAFVTIADVVEVRA